METDVRAGRIGFAGALGVVILFAALARGAHDLWAATLVHLSLAFLFAGLVVSACRRREPLRWPLLVPAAALVAAALLAALAAANRFDAVFSIKDLIAALMAFYVGANAFDSEESGEILLLLVVPGLWIQAASGVIQLDAQRALGGEAPGTLINANIQAAFTLFWIPPLLSRYVNAHAEGRARYWYWATGLAAAAVSLTTAGSAWAWACLGTAGLISAARRATHPGRRRALLAGVAVLLIFVGWYKLSKTYEWNVPGVPARGAGDRIDWWKTGLRMFCDHPGLGIGPGGYAAAFPAYKVGTGQSTRFAHSAPVTVLAESGLVGAAAVAVFALAWWRRRDGTGDLKRAASAGAGLFTAFCLLNIGAEYLVNLLTLGLFLGIAGRWERAPRAVPRWPGAVLAAGLAVVAAPFLASPFFASRLIVTGTEELSAGRFDEAREKFDAAAALDGTAWEAFRGRALAAWAGPTTIGERRESALRDIARATELNRLNAMIWWERGLMERDAGRADEALASLKRAAELDPRHRAIADDLKTLEIQRNP